MRKFLQILCLVAVIVLLLAGHLNYGLALAFVWMVYRIYGFESNTHKQHALTHDLLYILTSDLTPAQRQTAAHTYIDAINREREKVRKDWLWKMQNYGLKEDDPRWVK